MSAIYPGVWLVWWLVYICTEWRSYEYLWGPVAAT